MAVDGVVRAESHVGRRSPVIGRQEVGRGVERARAAGEEERKWGKGGGPGGSNDRFKLARRGGGQPTGWRHVVGKG
jgi:hypothetical protein